MILCICRYRIHHTYQFWLFCSTWALPIIGDIEMYTCGFGDAGTMCDARKFLIIFASAIGKPTLSQLACGQTRPWSVAGFLGFFVIMAVFFFNGPRVDLSFYRNAVYCMSHGVNPLTTSLDLPYFPQYHLSYPRKILSTALCGSKTIGKAV